MDDGNKKPDTAPERQAGLPQNRILYIIIIGAMVILAVVLVAKFGFNRDLLTPSAGEMTVLVRQTPMAGQVQKVTIKPDITLNLHDLVTTETTITCSGTQTLCGKTCIDIATDPANCGSCGKVCSDNARKYVSDYSCSAGKCMIKTCQAGYGDCASKGSTDVNYDGCETNLLTGESWIFDPNAQRVYQQGTTDGKLYLLDAQNCGACGNKCISPNGNVFAFCDNGACKKVCNGAWSDCNNNMADGCEQMWDNNNCGACGAKCPANSSCNVGCCQLKTDPKTSVPDSLGGRCRGAWVIQQ